MDYEALIKESGLPNRLKKEFKSRRLALDFSNKEFIPLVSKSGSEGLLIVSPTIKMVSIPFWLSKVSLQKDGGQRPIICDVCYCWLPRSKVSMIRFLNAKDKLRSHSFYCCAKLNCSENVREFSSEFLESRANLREDISIQDRVARLEKSLRRIIVTSGY